MHLLLIYVHEDSIFQVTNITRQLSVTLLSSLLFHIGTDEKSLNPACNLNIFFEQRLDFISTHFIVPFHPTLIIYLPSQSSLIKSAALSATA